MLEIWNTFLQVGSDSFVLGVLILKIRGEDAVFPSAPKKCGCLSTVPCNGPMNNTADC